MGIGIYASNNVNSALHSSENNLKTTFQQLASGKRINSAKDDAAGLAIIERFAAQIIGSSQAYRNVNDGVSMAQTADSFTGQINDLMQRGRELAMQSSNGTMSDTDRSALQVEFSMVQDEVKRLTGAAEFNGQKLLNQDSEMEFQVGSNATAADKVTVKTADLQGSLSNNGFFSADLSTQAGSQAFLAVADDSMAQVSTQRAEYGATMNRFESISRNLQNTEENLSASKSRILDTDYARTMSEHTKNLLLNNAASAMHSQATFSQQQVMSLLGSL
ncbi:MAG: flagellin [gamma proteobacterium symbiont of Taylorina sp.]|nr:flagellin [gamma proteobacterium symbiont of Taylorina sp.]